MESTDSTVASFYSYRINNILLDSPNVAYASSPFRVSYVNAICSTLFSSEYVRWVSRLYPLYLVCRFHHPSILPDHAVSNLFKALGLPVTLLPIAILSASLSTTPLSPPSSSNARRMSASVSTWSPEPRRMEGAGTVGKVDGDGSTSGRRSLSKSERRLGVIYVSCFQ